MRYKQLTQEQRYAISSLLQDGFTLTLIARIIKCHKSTVSREIKRNSVDGIYTHKAVSAHDKAMARRRYPRHTAWDLNMIAHVVGKLKRRWSPQQIVGWSKKHGVDCVSHECIYQFIWKDKARGGTLYRCLRHHGRKRKAYTGTKETRGQFNEAASIDDRPKEVEKRDVFGHLEGDLIIGTNRSGSVITLVDRALRRLWAKVLPNKSEEVVTEAIITLLKPIIHLIKSITFDRGKEFSGYKRIEKELGIKIYFAHAYSAWERGTNENTNGLLRDYFPKKKTDFKKVSQETLHEKVTELNQRPRRCLNYASPTECYNELLAA